MDDLILHNNRHLIDEILTLAISEDIGHGDVTTSLLIPVTQRSSAVLMAKSEFIVAGLPFAQRVFQLIDETISFKPVLQESSSAKKGRVIAEIKGNTGCILRAERTALNILQRTCGIATLTNRYVQELKGLDTRITDTRKTAPGLRFFDKYAVRAGGGHNHRYGLFDGILIKDNHIEASGGVGKAVRTARKRAHHLLKIEVEVKNLTEVKQAVTAGADVIMLDNMPPDKMGKAVDAVRSNRTGVIIEASGNINLTNIREIAETGVDIISIGSLTHSAQAADISLTFKPGKR